MYRQHRAAEQVKLAWSVTRQVLYNHFLVSKSKTNKFQPNKQQSQANGSQSNNVVKQSGPKSFGYVPHGYCFSFHNKGKDCPLKSDCPFRHECPNCLRGIHPAHSCRDKMSGWKSQNTQSTANAMCNQLHLFHSKCQPTCTLDSMHTTTSSHGSPLPTLSQVRSEELV